MSQDLNPSNGNNNTIQSDQTPNLESDFTPNIESELSASNQMQSSESNQSLLRQQSSAFRSKIAGSEFFASLLDYTTENNVESVKNILTENKLIDIKRCSDSKGYSLLHKAILNNQTDLVKFFIQYAYNFETHVCQTQEQCRANIQKWINQQTKEDKFTPLHLASFRGLVDVMDLLDEYNVDYSLKNVKGTNVVHFAAQGDQPKALIYLKNKGIDQNMVDDKQGTALHWASFLGHENSVNYLLSWGVDLNKQDNDGLTPLHLSTLMGFSRIVKKLLQRGADRNLKDEKGKTPFDIAQEKGYSNIMALIRTNPWSVQEFCNIKPVFKPVKFPLRQLLLFLVMYWLGIFIYVIFDFPFFGSKYYWGSYASLIIIFITMLFFILSWQKDPGYLKAQKKKRNTRVLLQLVKQIPDAGKICPDCIIIKPERSRHCEICQSCIMVYDHHCPWINNCVGAKNHFYFFCFIISMWCNLTILMILMMINLNEHYPKHNSYFPWFNEGSKLRPSPAVKDTFLIANFVFASFFVIALTFLIIVQFNNLLMNKTTFERFNQHVAQQSSQSSISFDQENQGQSQITQSLLSNQQQDRQSQIATQRGEKSCRNCMVMCCKNEKVYEYGHYSASSSLSSQDNRIELVN